MRTGADFLCTSRARPCRPPPTSKGRTLVSSRGAFASARGGGDRIHVTTPSLSYGWAQSESALGTRPVRVERQKRRRGQRRKGYEAPRPFSALGPWIVFASSDGRGAREWIGGGKRRGHDSVRLGRGERGGRRRRGWSAEEKRLWWAASNAPRVRNGSEIARRLGRRPRAPEEWRREAAEAKEPRRKGPCRSRWRREIEGATARAWSRSSGDGAHRYAWRRGARAARGRSVAGSFGQGT